MLSSQNCPGGPTPFIFREKEKKGRGGLFPIVSKNAGEGGCYAIFCLFFTAEGAITKGGNFRCCSFIRVSKRSVLNKNIFSPLFPFFPGESSPPPASLLWGERENTRKRGEKGKESPELVEIFFASSLLLSNIDVTGEGKKLPKPRRLVATAAEEQERLKKKNQNFFLFRPPWWGNKGESGRQKKYLRTRGGGVCVDKMRKKKYKAKEMPSSKGAGEALAVAAAVWCCFVTGKTKNKKVYFHKKIKENRFCCRVKYLFGERKWFIGMWYHKGSGFLYFSTCVLWK